MKLIDLLEEVEMGTDNYKKLKAIEKIKSTPEESKISSLLKFNIENLKENSELIILLSQAQRQIKQFEDKKRRAVIIQESYARMRYDAFKATYNSIIENINENVNNAELVSNAVALIQVIIEEVAEKAKLTMKLDEHKELNELIKKEFIFIKENI